jgi:hypothetical protein
LLNRPEILRVNLLYVTAVTFRLNYLSSGGFGFGDDLPRRC